MSKNKNKPFTGSGNAMNKGWTGGPQKMHRLHTGAGNKHYKPKKK